MVPNLSLKTLCRVVGITAILASVGCLGPTQRATNSVPEPTMPRGSTVPSLQDPGTLAYVGSDGNVWITSPVQGWTRQVTEDATAPPEGQGRSYHRIAWSRDGALAFAAVVRTSAQARGELFLQQSLDHPPRLIAQDDEHFFIYLYNSPITRSGQDGYPLLAYLVEEENGVGLHLVREEETGLQDLLLAVGRPFYLSWSPDAREILWHTGGSLRDNPAAEIGLYQVEENRRRILPYAPGEFLAPAWSPLGQHWMGAIAAEGKNYLRHITPDGGTTLATTEEQGIAFVWSPSGRHIAHAARRWDGASFYGPVHITDLETRETRQVTSDSFNVLGFFWSPDGRQLAYLSRLDLPNAVWMQWRVFDRVSGRDRGFAAFHPSPLMRFIVHSFNQYAQNHRFWSADGRYLVYADRDNGGQDRVWLVDIEAEKGTDPILIDEGSIGVWAWR